MADVSLRWWHLVALLGALQGLVLAGSLVARRENRTANRLLAAALLAFSIYLASVAHLGADLVARMPWFFGVGHPMPLLFGPLLYLYGSAATDRAWRFEPRDVLHFVPALAVVIAGLPIYAMSGPEKVALLAAMRRGDVPLVVSIGDVTKLVSGIAYSVALLRALRAHRARVRDSYSSLDRVVLDWLRWLAWAGAAIWAAAVVLQLIGAGLPPESGDRVVAIAMTVLIYLIGDRGLRQPEIFRYESGTDMGTDMGTDLADTPMPRATLSPSQARTLEAALLDLMQREEPWRDPDLTLGALASRLRTSTHKLSEVLNARVGLSFYDFVNGYRVREVQRRLAEPDAGARKLTALALDAGFASKSTFNAVFKRHVGVTPSSYRATPAESASPTA